MLYLAIDCFAVKGGCKNPVGVSNHFLGGLIAVVMGIVTMVCLMRNMPRKIKEVTLYSGKEYCIDTMIKGHHVHELPPPSISGTEYMLMMKRMAELEERVNILTMKPSTMPQERRDVKCCSKPDKHPSARASSHQEVTRNIAQFWKLRGKNRDNSLVIIIHVFNHFLVQVLEDSLVRQQELVKHLEKKKKKKLSQAYL